MNESPRHIGSTPKADRSSLSKATDRRINDAMKDAMKRQSLTHAQLANRLGVKQPHVSRMLSGESGVVPESLVNALNALGLELRVGKATFPANDANHVNPQNE